MTIDVQIIPHNKQRYPTSGDWWVGRAPVPRDSPSLGAVVALHVRVSAMGDWGDEMLVAHHEITEALLCIAAGIEGKDVDAFDIAFEKARKDDNDEPGDSPAAPYYKQHQIATGFERIMAAEMGVDWNSYEQANLDL